MDELTPVELRNGVWYKREDLYRIDPPGVNGSKLRACRHLMSRAVIEGAEKVVSAASVHSPQSAMAAVLADKLGLECTVIVGATTPEKAIKHKAIQIAHDFGAHITSIPVAYNTALQRAGAVLAEAPNVWQLPYGITTPSTASLRDVEDFVRVGARQAVNIPDEVTDLILPFGSANTACGVLYGLQATQLKRIHLMEIGPSRRVWATARLSALGQPLAPPWVELQWHTLHEVWASYGDKMPETCDDITFHPTYEGKIIRWLNATRPEWWTRRDGTTLFWIVGGPI